MYMDVCLDVLTIMKKKKGKRGLIVSALLNTALKAIAPFVCAHPNCAA